MSDQKQNPIAGRFEAYLLGQLDDAATDQLEAELREDPQRVDECIDVMKTLAMIREQFRDRGQQADELTRDPTLRGFHNLLSELCVMEDAAETESVQWVGLVKTTRPFWQQWQFIIPSSIAALFAIAVTLIVTLPNNNTTNSDRLTTNDPTEPGHVGSEGPRIVATLTAERDAQWAGVALVPGSPLQAGQRLTLTQGFAQITTNRGAVAILQAPCTFELLDQPNAIRLNTGRLVGICETESSKGFLVRTPHMEITDLGTQFGVDAASSSVTRVHVIEGEIETVSTAAPTGTQPTLLTTGESASANADSGVITTIDHDTGRFAAIVPRSFSLPGTGVGLAASEVDENWRVVEVRGQAVDPPLSLQVSDIPAHYVFFPSDPETSQMVIWNPNDEPAIGDAYSYVLATQITVPETFDPKNTQLAARFMVDNELVEIRVNGQPILVDIENGAFLSEFDRWLDFVVDEHLVSGTNTIKFKILNHRTDESPASFFGLRMEWSLMTSQSVFDQNNAAP